MKYIGIPKNFLWGASTSAFQVEGGYKENGKGLSIADIRSFRNSETRLDTKETVDGYHLWKKDISLMKDLGMKSYRFSISWPRVFPNGDEEKPNKEGLQYYHNLINELKRNNIEPIVTMYHFDQPYGLIKKYGGWVSRESINDFVKYAKCLFDEFGNDIKYWLTINEQAVLVVANDMLGISQDLPIKEKFQKAFQANYNMWLAQAIVYKICRERFPDTKIGPAISYITTLPASKKSIDMMEAKNFEDFYSFSQMDVAIHGEIPKQFTNELDKLGIDIKTELNDKEILQKGRANILGVNWYCTTIVEAVKDSKQSDFIFKRMKRVQDKNLLYTEWGWNFDPVGFRYGLRQVMDHYGNIPIIVSECGWSEKEKLENGKVHDLQRIKYLNDHIEQMGLAMNDGVNVISFNPWSFIDILSAGDGMEKRYGLVFVDRNNFEKKQLKRYKKDSFFFYKNVIKDNN